MTVFAPVSKVLASIWLYFKGLILFDGLSLVYFKYQNPVKDRPKTLNFQPVNGHLRFVMMCPWYG